MKQSKLQEKIAVERAGKEPDVNRTPDVHLSLSALEDSIGILMTAIKHLEGRLRPVMSRDIETNYPPAREGLCGVSQRINCQISVVESAVSSIHDIVAALEV